MDRFELKSCIEGALPGLLAFNDPALTYSVRKDLLNEKPVDALLSLPEVVKFLERQKPEGYWPYPSTRKSAHPAENYHILQSYRVLGELIDRYRLDMHCSAVARAAEYMFSHQTPEGDIRGIFGSQYAPHYTAGIIELLIKAGYTDDPRITKAINWFKDIQGEDGGWAWPLRTTKITYQEAIEMDEPIQPDLTKPFSHALTGFVIRVLSIHPDFREDPMAEQAGEVLKERFFKADKYPDRKGTAYWFKFQYPFWWGNLLTALDSLAKLGFSVKDPDITKGLAWFQKAQQDDGFWPTGYGRGKGADRNQAWVALAICRMMKGYG